MPLIQYSRCLDRLGPHDSDSIKPDRLVALMERARGARMRCRATGFRNDCARRSLRWALRYPRAGAGLSAVRLGGLPARSFLWRSSWESARAAFIAAQRMRLAVASGLPRGPPPAHDPSSLIQPESICERLDHFEEEGSWRKKTTISTIPLPTTTCSCDRRLLSTPIAQYSHGTGSYMIGDNNIAVTIAIEIAKRDQHRRCTGSML